MTVRGVIFDVGGTLTTDPTGGSFEAPGTVAVAQLLHDQQLLDDPVPFAAGLLAWRRANPKEGEDFRNINSTRDGLRQVADAFDLRLDDETLRELELEFHRPFIERAAPVAGMPELVQSLASDVRLAVVSNTRSHELIAGLVERFGLLHLFDPFLTSERFGRRKPSQRIFEAVLECWGYDPHEVAMVGDSPTKDIVGAARAGIRSVLVGPACSGSADAVARSVAELEAILRRMIHGQ